MLGYAMLSLPHSGSMDFPGAKQDQMPAPGIADSPIDGARYSLRVMPVIEDQITKPSAA